MTNEEIKELEERTYAIGWSGFPIDTLFNDIRDNNDPRFNKNLAYQDFKKIIDEIYILKAKAQKYDEKETPKKPIIKQYKNSEHYLCPNCKNYRFGIIDYGEYKNEWRKGSELMLYCPKCGQAIDRSDEDDK